MLCLVSLFLAAPHVSAAPSIWSRPLSTFAEAKHDGFPFGSATDERTKTQSVFVLAQGGARAPEAANRGGFSHAPVAVAPANTSFSFEITGNLNTPRFRHTATLLPNGQVLVAGGLGSGGDLASAELFDPDTGSWTPTRNLNTLRAQHTATLLPNGQVLAAGGFNYSSGYLASTELFNPASGSWTPTGSLNTPHYLHSATLLPNGQVLVAGGVNNNGSDAIASAELFNPDTGSWTPTGNLNNPRYSHTATLLPNGQVLVAGGYDGNGAIASAELFDQATGSWSPTGNLNTPRYFHTATLLTNGQVLVAGGYDGNGAIASAELFNQATGSWSPTGNLNTPRYFHTATLLTSGQVLVAGGFGNDSGGDLASAELFNQATGSWTPTGSLNTPPRDSHTATLLPNGQVLVAGGFNGIALASAELFNGAVLGNISTRLNVGTGDNVLIGGFIVTGTQPKKVIVRAIGPSLTVNGVPLAGRLLNPTLALNGPNGLIASNDNWQDDPVQAAEIIATGIPPTDNLESAIVATLPASPAGIGYTAVMSGVNNTTGIGLVEAYDLDRTVDSTLANISTRGLVQTGDDVMIGGLIALGTGSQKVLVRAIGPSLANAVPPVADALADPVLELYDSNGTLLAMNDNWQDDPVQAAEIIATGIPPTDNLESAIVANLPASNTGIGYTAIVRGANGTTGVALVEFYALAP